MTEKTEAELEQAAVDARKQLREERFAAAGARAKDPSKARVLRKTVARILTEKRARTLSSEQSPRN